MNSEKMPGCRLEQVEWREEATIKTHAHGIVLYLAWFIFGFLILATKRYWRTNYFGMHFLHMFLGTVLMIVTVVMSCFVICYAQGKILKGSHNILGMIVLILVCVSWGLGLAAGISGKF